MMPKEQPEVVSKDEPMNKAAAAPDDQLSWRGELHKFVVRAGKVFHYADKSGRQVKTQGEELMLDMNTAKQFASHLFIHKPDENTPADLLGPPLAPERLSPEEYRAATAPASDLEPPVVGGLAPSMADKQPGDKITPAPGEPTESGVDPKDRDPKTAPVVKT
jgi:hypothetical protein